MEIYKKKRGGGGGRNGDLETYRGKGKELKGDGLQAKTSLLPTFLLKFLGLQ